MRYLLIVYCSLLCLSSLKAQTSAPLYSNEFMSIGVGARAFGMGNAVVATCNQIETAFWNPANLVGLKNKYAISLMHADYFAGMAAFDYVGFGVEINSESSLGVSLIRLGVDEIPNTLELVDMEGNIRYDRVTTFSAADYAFLFSYARKTRIEGLQVGGNMKIIYRHIGDFASAYGFGIDAALSFSVDKWRVGAVLRDVTTTFNTWIFDAENLEEVFKMTGNDLPVNSNEITLPSLIVGVSRDFMISQKVGVLAEMDIDFTFGGKRHVLVKGDLVNIDPHMGFEARYLQLIFLRAGVGRIQREKGFSNREYLTFQPNLGVGIHFKGFSLDYSLTDIGDQSIVGYSNVLSLSYSFD